MSRDSYSVYYVLSAHLAQQIVVTDRLHSLLICWADTDPQVKAYTVGGPRLQFSDEKGKQREAQSMLVVTTRTNQVEHWDATWLADLDHESHAIRIKRDHATETGATYRLFSRRTFEANRIETKNRKSAQRILFAGNGIATEKAECQALMALVDGPKSIAMLGSILDTTTTFATLVALRLWLSNRVTLPMVSSLMQPHWMVERSGHGG